MAFEVLERGEWELALKEFDAYLGPKDKSYWSRDFWAADRHQGRALAYAGQNDWTQALKAIDAALDQRRTDFKSGMCKCHGVVEMHLTKAAILDKLGKADEAEKERQEAASENLPHAALPAGIARQGVPVGVYYDWLKELRLKILQNKIGK